MPNISTQLLRSKYFKGTSYRQIAPSGKRCGKTSWRRWPRRCYHTPVLTRSSCENACTKFNDCIAYSHKEALRICHLFISSKTESCPSGYILASGPAITTIDQLIGVDEDGISGCYGKVRSKTKYASTYCLF